MKDTIWYLTEYIKKERKKETNKVNSCKQNQADKKGNALLFSVYQRHLVTE